MTRVRSPTSRVRTELPDSEELVGTGGQLGDVVDRVVRKVLVACDAHASHIRLALASLQ
jgi:hypothetical protein